MKTALRTISKSNFCHLAVLPLLNPTFKIQTHSSSAGSLLLPDALTLWFGGSVLLSSNEQSRLNYLALTFLIFNIQFLFALPPSTSWQIKKKKRFLTERRLSTFTDFSKYKMYLLIIEFESPLEHKTLYKDPRTM